MSLACPSCRVDLVMSERQGVGIDYCPKCRGVWLDRGELDKIIERAELSDGGSGSRGSGPSGAPTSPVNQCLFGAAAPMPPLPMPQQAPPQYGRGHDMRRRDDDDDDDRRRYGDQRYPQKRKSWLSDIFD